MSFFWILAGFSTQILFHSQMRQTKWMGVLEDEWDTGQTSRPKEQWSAVQNVTGGKSLVVLIQKLIEVLMLLNIFIKNQSDDIESIVSKV